MVFGGEGGEEGCGAGEGADDEVDAAAVFVVVIAVAVFVGEVGDGEGVEAEFFVRGGEGCGGEGKVDVLAWVEGLL